MGSYDVNGGVIDRFRGCTPSRGIQSLTNFPRQLKDVDSEDGEMLVGV